MRSASNRDVFQSRLQVLHIHILFVAPLSTCHMAQPGVDQHEGGVSVRKRAHHTGPAADLPVQSLNHIVGADPDSMFIGKITVSQRFPNTIFHLLGCLLQLHFSQLSNHSFGFFIGCLFALLGMDCLERLGH